MKQKHSYATEGKVWVYPGTAGWYFVHVDTETSQSIKEATPRKKAFGSVPVRATIGETSWQTSIFPSAKDGVYLLPLKAEIRKKENIFEGDSVRVHLSLA